MLHFSCGLRSCGCLCLFLTVPRVDLWSVIVALPDHTHFFVIHVLINSSAHSSVFILWHQLTTHKSKACPFTFKYEFR